MTGQTKVKKSAALTRGQQAQILEGEGDDLRHRSYPSSLVPQASAGQTQEHLFERRAFQMKRVDRVLAAIRLSSASGSAV